MKQSLRLSCGVEVSCNESQEISWVVARNHGHPWDGRPGFDLLEFETSSRRLCDRFVAAAASRHWKPWLIGTSDDGMFGGALYKPTGIRAEWVDDGLVSSS
jgi:hypothetical protein